MSFGGVPSASIVNASVAVDADGSVTPFVAVIVCEPADVGEEKAYCADWYGADESLLAEPRPAIAGKSTAAMPESGSAALAVSRNEPDWVAFSHSVFAPASYAWYCAPVTATGAVTAIVGALLSTTTVVTADAVAFPTMSVATAATA